MLVLTRKPGESIEIGDDITVTILKTGRYGGAVRIGIDAPKMIGISRSEMRVEDDEDSHQPTHGTEAA